MGIPKLKDERFSYADYMTWPDDERWEIIYGIPYNMSPAPNKKHQVISRNLLTDFAVYLKGKKCQVFSAPFDVRLSEKDSDDESVFNVVQPDISIFCDKKKLDKKGAIGAPDMVVEILSDSTSQKDLSIKLLLYQDFGVKEYWIVDPDKDTLHVYRINDKGRYKLHKLYTKEEKVKPGIFPDLEIDLKEVFE